MKPRIFIEGSLAFDRIFVFPGKFVDHFDPKKLHALSVSFFVERTKEDFGGTAGNIAYTLALLGHIPAIIARLGNDGASYRSRMRRFGINHRSVLQTKNRATPNAMMFTDLADNQIAGFEGGAMMVPMPQTAIPRFRKGDVVIVAPGNMQDMVHMSRAARAAHARYIFDPGQQLPVLTRQQIRDLVRGAEVVVVNDYERDLLLRRGGLTLKHLLAQTQMLITTFGARGSEFLSHDARVRIPAARVTAVDPTGAGDAYRAGLIHGMVHMFPPEKTGRIAAMTAAYAVEKRGTQNHTFTRSGFETRLKKEFHITL